MGGSILVHGALYPALLYVSDNYNWDLKYSLVLPHTGRQLFAMPDAEPKSSEFSRGAVRNPFFRGTRSQRMEEVLNSLKRTIACLCVGMKIHYICCQWLAMSCEKETLGLCWSLLAPNVARIKDGAGLRDQFRSLVNMFSMRFS